MTFSYDAGVATNDRFSNRTRVVLRSRHKTPRFRSEIAMTSTSLPHSLMTRFPLPTDRLSVPQGFGRVDGADLVYDRPFNSRADYERLSDELLVGQVQALN